MRKLDAAQNNFLDALALLSQHEIPFTPIAAARCAEHSPGHNSIQSFRTLTGSTEESKCAKCGAPIIRMVSRAGTTFAWALAGTVKRNAEDEITSRASHSLIEPIFEPHQMEALQPAADVKSGGQPRNAIVIWMEKDAAFRVALPDGWTRWAEQNGSVLEMVRDNLDNLQPEARVNVPGLDQQGQEAVLEVQKNMAVMEQQHKVELARLGADLAKAQQWGNLWQEVAVARYDKIQRLIDEAKPDKITPRDDFWA